MPSDLQVDNIKDGSSTKTLAEYSSSAWSWGAGTPIGTVLQFLHFENTETNGLDASYTNLYENSITLKSASSDVFVMIQANYILPANQGFGCKYTEIILQLSQLHTQQYGQKMQLEVILQQFLMELIVKEMMS